MNDDDVAVAVVTCKCSQDSNNNSLLFIAFTSGPERQKRDRLHPIQLREGERCIGTSKLRLVRVPSPSLNCDLPVTSMMPTVFAGMWQTCRDKGQNLF